MDPISATLIAASAAMSAGGKIIEGNAQGAAADANAKIAEQNRVAALQQAGAREDQQRRRAAYSLGSQVAAVAESGIDPGSGSTARAIEQSATNAELDALNIRYEGLMHGKGYEREAMLERQRGKQARQAGYYGAASSILNGAAQAYGGRPMSGGSTGGGWGPSGSRDYW